ncbi:polyprenyl synthetase family protein [Streptomyces sp.]|uniref:polyprenyl synthetase family protein n=1 Tax=Streptomyces sp. TaxID=1931 RepID=UPI002D794CEB|nr:polyprenyl synthetase family protein [Streptomyces sp.]HET6353188.1 polyprenyl synthetase family protein [Streptomyces sp.]
MAPLTHAVPDLMDVRQAVDAVLAEFLAAKRRSARPTTRELIDTLRDFLFAGGKRIRPMMCMCGWYAADGRGDPEPVMRAAASLELFHAFPLIHDDVMDNSDIRRGRSTVHRLLAERHRGRGGPGNADRFGLEAAVLPGDLALARSGELLRGKCIALMAIAVAWATPAQLRLLHALVGRPDLTEEQADAVRAVLEATGARLEVERMIARRFRRALAARDRTPFPESATAALRQLAYATSARRS